MEQILKLEPGDDITSIKSRVEFALTPPVPATPGGRERRKSRLLLVVPRSNEALQSLVNMKLLARIGRTWPVEIGIVSDHPLVRDYAKEAGIKVFASLGGAERASWVPFRASVAPPEATLPPVAPVPAQGDELGQPPKADRKRPTQRKKYVVISGSGRRGILYQLGTLALILILAVVLILGIVALMPEATVTITPVAQNVETNLVVKADADIKSVDFQTLSFPARVAQVELAMVGEIETVETELAPVGKATGFVTFINRTEQAQTIPISIALTTSAGEAVEFVTTVTATIPPGIDATTVTTVAAVEPGPKGNVAAGQINRFVQPAYNLLARTVNEQPLSGGTLESAKVVVQDDKERLNAYLRQIVQQEGYRQLQESLGEQEFVPQASLQVIVLDISYKEFAGDFSDTFGGEMQAVVRGIVVGGYNANRLALAALEAQVPPGYKLDARGLQFGAGEVLDVQERSAVFRVIATGKAVPEINSHEIADRIAWLPVGEAQALLSQRYQLATVPGVELKPDWLAELLGRMPYFPIRIKVVIKDAVILVADGE